MNRAARILPIVVAISMSGGCDVEPPDVHRPRIELTQADHEALAHLGVSATATTATSVTLLAEDDETIGRIDLREDGTVRSTLAGSTWETVETDVDVMAVACNDVLVAARDGEPLAIADAKQLHDCADARAAATIVQHAAGLEVAELPAEAPPLEGAQAHESTDDLATPVDPNELMACSITFHDCWAWDSSGCTQAVTCTVNTCSGDYGCDICASPCPFY